MKKNSSLKITNIFYLLIFFTPFLFSLEFIPCDDPRLNEVSQSLTKKEILSEDTQSLINEMLILSGHQANTNHTGKKSVLVGLAAPQVGVLKQIIIIDTRSIESLREKTSKPTFDVLINPVITYQSDEVQCSYEGCFSVPEKYFGTPKRAASVKVKASDRNGNIYIKTYEKFTAVVVQHEIDHLNGIRFPEKIQSENELHIVENNTELADYQKNWKNWEKHASLDEWSEMKNKNYKPI